MANKIYTAFQEMSKVFDGGWNVSNGIANLEPMPAAKDVIYKTEDPEQYQHKKLELQQNKYLANRWKRVNQNLSMSAFAGLSNVKLMYRDADLMDAYPEIGAALDLISEESSQPSSEAHGMIVKVSSKSDRIKSILEDLFVNRLNLQVTAQMVIRAMCKYGNQFMLLDIDKNLGVKGWRQLPVAEVERVENGIINPYGGGSIIANQTTDADKQDMSTKFIWTNEAGGNLVPFKNWQIAHFRLLHNSMYLPYGVSALLSARRHFRMLALMEDSMLIYRLERSMERRVYKIYVGALDDDDIQPYIEQVADQFKRTPIVDPLTGQLDLRKNILPVWRKTPIPLLDGRTITIEELAKEYEEGKENYVYSVQDNTHRIVPGKVVWCGKNYTAEKMYKIILDDDTYMVMAGEHEIIMRDGSKKRADEVATGESIMPFYKKIDKNSKKLFDRYEKVYNPETSKYEFTHRLIASGIIKESEEFNTVHHKDFNKYNNRPDNLLWCDYFEHHKMHSELAKKNWQDPEKRAIHIQRLSEACKSRSVTEEAKGKISSTLKNHKIKTIEVIEGDDVYCMTVVGQNGEEDRHNFALQTFINNEEYCTNGCFVSNCASDDLFIPVRSEDAATPVDTLAGAKNLDAIDDIKYIQKKVCAALRIPQSFLNFEEAQGDGKNLALMDVRFARTINKYQQAFLMELTKVATIHLYLLGFEDDLTNFNLTMNNPSTQAEQLEIENLQKKISCVRDAVSDPGNGLPVISLQRALKEILKWSDKDIKDNFEEIRLEKALSAELEKTNQIIKRTGVFDAVDRIYGEPGAEYQEEQGGAQGGPDGGAPGGGGFGGGLDMMGAPGEEEGMEESGQEGQEPTQSMNSEGAPESPENSPEPAQTMESTHRSKKSLMIEQKALKQHNKNADKVFSKIVEGMIRKSHEGEIKSRVDVFDKTLRINEEFEKMFGVLDDFKNATID